MLITGGGGFIGGWLAETLFLHGERVRVGVHHWTGAVRPARFPMEIVLCDMMNPEQIEAAMQDIRCVIHCARGADNEIAPGARNLLEAAARHGVERFVYVSTTEVFGNQVGDIDETVSPQSMNDPYADGKIESEGICWEYCRKGLLVTVVRPPIVYGPYGKVFTSDIANKLVSGNWSVYPEIADGTCNLVYVSDLVNGILLAARCNAAIGETFILNGPETITWNQFFQEFNAALGLPDLNICESKSVKLTTMLKEPIRSLLKYARYHYEKPIRAIASKQRQLKQMMKFVENRMKTTLRAHELHLYSRKVSYSHNKARELLGYQPKVTLDEGLSLCVQWLDQVGWTELMRTKRSEFAKD